MSEQNLYCRIVTGQLTVGKKSPPLHRFWAKVDKEGPIHPQEGQCWVWKDKPFSCGYGYITVKYRQYRAHRYSWIVHRGHIPAGLCVLHRCDNRTCVNPSHLFLGTQKDNEKDKTSKMRQAYGEKIGVSKLTQKQVLEIRQKYRRGSKSYGQTALARMYGVHQTAISRILLRKNWRYC